MQNQLTLDALIFEEAFLPGVPNGEFAKWRAFEFLEHVEGMTCLLTANDREREFNLSVPVVMGEQKFSNFSSSTVSIERITSKDSQLFLHKPISYIQKENDHFKVFYTDIKFSEGKMIDTKSLPPFESIVNFRPFCREEIPVKKRKKQNLTEDMAIDEVLVLLEGSTVTVEHYLRDDWVWRFVSAPFTINSAWLENGSLHLIGDEEIFIHSNHFKNHRIFGDHVIFDCRNEESGQYYGVSLYL